MRYIYGPVPSRRLGFSLGVDIVPYKTCTLDCIYCQLGRTTNNGVERQSFAPREEIIEEIRKSISSGHDIDFITFSGSGEPTLNSDVGNLIHEVKKITSIPVAVLTNGTLLFREDVQKDLLEPDAVLPSLDAASQRIFRSINRPHDSLKIETIIDGLKRFRKFYKGSIWLEVMLVKGFNDERAELSRIKKMLTEIKPNKIHLNTVIRPPSETCAYPLNSAEMMAIKYFLGENCEIIAEFHGKRNREAQEIEDYIIEMTKRRPVTIVDIANVIGISEANAKQMIKRLKAKSRLKEKQYQGKKYYSYTIEK